MIYAALPLTLILYILVRHLYRKYPHPLINPLLIPTLILIALIAYFKLPLADYQKGSWPISALLNPAVVALALPLYQQLQQIRKKLKLIAICTLSGVFISVVIALILGLLLGAHKEMIASLITRSITTPIAMPVSQTMGGSRRSPQP